MIRDYSSIPVFPVAVYPNVFVAVAKQPNHSKTLQVEKMSVTKDLPEIAATRSVKWNNLVTLDGESWSIVLSAETGDPTVKIEAASKLLEDVADVGGAATVTEAYEYKDLVTEYTPRLKEYFALVNTGTVDRYAILWGQRPTRYIKSTFQKPVIPQARWDRISAKRRKESQNTKIIVGGMTKILECAYDSGKCIAGKSTSIVVSDSLNLMYLLGLMNSRLMSWYYRKKFADLVLQGGYLRIGPPQLKKMPIHAPGPADKSRHDKMVALAERMLDLHKQKQAAKSTAARDRIAREIHVTDEQIDALVYELYGLTDEEIRVVEGAR